MNKELQVIVWSKNHISPTSFRLAVTEWLLKKREEWAEEEASGFWGYAIDELLADLKNNPSEVQIQSQENQKETEK
jgi:hypothetical protein